MNYSERWRRRASYKAEKLSEARKQNFKDFYVELIKVKERHNLEQRKLMLKKAKCLPIFRLAWEVSYIMKQSRFIMLFVELSILIFSNLIFPKLSASQNCFAEALLNGAKHINIEQCLCVLQRHPSLSMQILFAEITKVSLGSFFC